MISYNNNSSNNNNNNSNDSKYNNSDNKTETLECWKRIKTILS